MGTEITPGKPTTRRYTPVEKEQAVRLVRQLRTELGTEHGTVQRIALQLGYGTESVRSWVAQADIDDGRAPGISTADAKCITELEQEVRELKRANEILKRAARFSGAELDHPGDPSAIAADALDDKQRRLITDPAAGPSDSSVQPGRRCRERVLVDAGAGDGVDNSQGVGGGMGVDPYQPGVQL